MAKQKVTIEVDIPNGWEPTGEFRPLNQFTAEYWLGRDGEVEFDRGGFLPKLILRKVKRYREPSLPADYGKECEVSDDGKKWVTAKLQGFAKNCTGDSYPWKSDEGYCTYCRIACDDTGDFK